VAIPTFEQAQIYKSPTIKSEIRALLQRDYPVFSGDFNEQFAGAALDVNGLPGGSDSAQLALRLVCGFWREVD